MSKWLYEYDTGYKYGPASDKHVEKYEAALSKGRPFFLYPAYGYEFRMIVVDVCNECGGSDNPANWGHKDICSYWDDVRDPKEKGPGGSTSSEPKPV